MDGAPIERLGEAKRRRAEQIWSAREASPGLLALQVVAGLFGVAVRFRRRAYEHGLLHAGRAAVPVISIGNLTVGGAGKTPFTRWLAEELAAEGKTPAILHGGYAEDEPALHRRWQPKVPVYVGRDRLASARAAADAGATVLLLDDGRQHLQLARDLDVVLISADTWDRPHRLLPAGAWREPITTLRKSDWIVITRKAASHEAADTIMQSLRAQIDPSRTSIASLELTRFMRLDRGDEPLEPGREVVVLCAIADPAALANQLESTGLRIIRVVAFDDHHDFTQADLQEVLKRAEGAAIVITEKDAVKIAAIEPGFPAWVVGQRVVLEAGADEFRAAVRQALQ